MVRIQLHDTRTISTSSGMFLTLHYYLLKNISRSYVTYGIKISSISDIPSKPDIHSEQVSNLSYSFTHTLALLDLCVEHLVTPTELFTSLDTLMNEGF